MPLLAKELEIFPDDLFDRESSDSWWVAHVRSRQEKTLGRDLLDRDVAFYLPQIEYSKQRAGRTFHSYLPLFAGYVFFCGNDSERKKVRQRPAVVNVLEVLDQDVLSAELAQIRRL